MKEADFTKNVNSRLDQSEVYSWKINDNFQGGVPDNWYLGVSRSSKGKKLPMFVEYKYLKALPKRETTAIIPDLSAQQLEWLRMLKDSGHEAAVVVGAPNGRTSGGVIFSEHEWTEGIPKSEFVRRMQSYQQLAHFITNVVNSVA